MSQNIPNETLAIELGRALSRLEQKILACPPNSRLQHSSYERTKTAAVSSASNALFSCTSNSSTLEPRIYA